MSDTPTADRYELRVKQLSEHAERSTNSISHFTKTQSTMDLVAALEDSHFTTRYLIVVIKGLLGELDELRYDISRLQDQQNT